MGYLKCTSVFLAIHEGASGLLTQARRGGINGPTTISILY